MLTASEQQELHQIEEDLRDTDRWFAWRLTLLQGVLRWAAPGRQAWLSVLAALTAALLRLVAATGAVADGDPDSSRRHGMAGLGLRAGARSKCQPGAGPAAA